jgi:hypothetical protein
VTNDDTFLNSQFAAYRDELMADVTPAGPGAVRATVRHRRRVAVTAGTALAIALIAGPAAGYAALSRGPAPPAPGTTLDPTISTSPTPSTSPSPSASATAPAGPDGRITKADLLKAKLTLPAWQSEAPSSCSTRGVRLAPEATGSRPGLMKLSYADADGDGAQETVTILGCRPGEAALQQVVVFDRDAAGNIRTLGQVTRTGSGFDWITDLKAGDAGSVQVEVGDIQPCCDTPASAARKQWRTYSWNGETFRQTGGPTGFSPRFVKTDLSITATDMRFTDGRGTSTVKIRNAGPADADYVYFWLDLGDNESAELHGDGWSACEEANTVSGAGSRELTCMMTKVRAGETKTLVLGATLGTAKPSSTVGKATVVRLDATRAPVGDANEDDNSAAFTLR